MYSQLLSAQKSIPSSGVELPRTLPWRNLVSIRMLRSIKRIQSETKDTLIEIKNNLQGNSSTVDETKSQINDLEHKEAKNNQS